MAEQPRSQPRLALVVVGPNHVHYGDIRGAATACGVDSVVHIDRLAGLYFGAKRDAFRRPCETRISYVVDLHGVRHYWA